MHSLRTYAELDEHIKKGLDELYIHYYYHTVRMKTGITPAWTNFRLGARYQHAHLWRRPWNDESGGNLCDEELRNTGLEIQRAPKKQ